MDALAYSPAGFLWDNALKHKVSIRHYGEGCLSECGWADKAKKGKPTWKDYLTDIETRANQTVIRCKPGIATLKPIAKLDTVGWDLGVPDQVRADRFIAELQQFEQSGSMPSLMIMLLPNDHTAGTSPNKPTPAAMVADNDLAFGRIVEALCGATRALAAAGSFRGTPFLAQRCLELAWGRAYAVKHEGKGYGWWLHQVMDFVAGLTDTYARQMSREIDGG